MVEYRGLHLNGRRVVLEYDVDGGRIRESPWVKKINGILVFQRDLELERSTRARSVVVVEMMGGQRGSIFQLADGRRKICRDCAA